VDIRNRKTVILIGLFDLVMGLLVLPLLISPRSIVAWWIIVAKGFLLLAVAILAAATIHWATGNILLRLSWRALRRADYDRALLLMHKMKALAKHEFHGTILALAGRPTEAEAIIGKLASEVCAPMGRARRLIILAEVLMDQGHWAQAKEILEEATRTNIGLGSPLATLADWYLLQGIEPQKALDLLEQANTALGSVALKPSVRNAILALRFATKALALARLGQHHEAESVILEAFRMADAKNVPGVALLHWYAGMAFAAMGQPSKASDHFQEAAAIDAQGKYGKLAVHWLEDDKRNPTTS
jgi:tetratricopeptide (TPR) repeat protein